MLDAALDYLAHAAPAEWPEGLQADCLRALAVAEARQTAAHAAVLRAFSVPGGGLNGDGQRSPRVWLTWQAQAMPRAAAGQAAAMRALAAHPRIAAALADGKISASRARQIWQWTGQLPEDVRDGADGELLGGSAAGADNGDLAGLAEQLYRDHAAPDTDDGFEDRGLRLAVTLGGAGRLEADLTGRATAALSSVLDSLSGVTGPEDVRTLAQRRHDALAEACTRLLAAGLLPERAGQPVRLELSVSLPELLANTRGDACDAAVQAIITGHPDYDELAARTDPGAAGPPAAAAGPGPGGHPQAGAISQANALEQAIALLSGPAGRAAALRARLRGGPALPLSLPLDISGTTDTIPVHLRRAVRKRDQHCRFPGCDMPPAGCDVHHIRHRKDGGRHTLTNLLLLCRFHHLIAIHRWDWTITLHPDGTTTAVSPDRTKTLHSHAPPTAA
jgi:Domain of unknown function (DUF222)/HNH endonuclease